ncbi:MAG: amidohydrolase family protein [Pseudomonadota bacterium]
MTNKTFALLSLLAAFAAGCGSDTPSQPAVERTAVDALVINANGYTMTNSELATFTTMVINDGKIVAIGDDTVADDYAAADTADLAGATVLPGLTDAHGHVSSLGKLRKTLDLAGVASLDATLGRIASYDASLGDQQQWLLGRGWNQVLWTEKRFPTAADLDAIVPDRPILLNRIDGHAAWANSRALELAGINDDTADPPGGRILRDADGKATGILVDSAMGIVRQAIPAETADAVREYIDTALVELASLGITSVHDAGATATEIDLYKELADAGKMTVRVSAMLGGVPTLEQFETPIVGYADDMFEATSVKLYADGALGSRGAAMIEPYSDAKDDTGLLFATANEMAEYIQAAHDKGFAANVHAIGDAANQTVLDAFAIVNDGKPSTFDDRVEHAQIVTLEDIERFAELDIIASVQPTHATSDKNMAEDRVGAERIKGAYAWQRMLDAGVRMAGGSDFPVEKPEMFDGLFAAVTRQSKDGEPQGGWYPDQKLNREQTLALFSLWAADSVGQADRLGSLETGKYADFIVLDRDYFEIPDDHIWQIQVRQTWVAGKPVFTAQ